MTLTPIIEKLVNNPKKLFLLDGLGAVLSAFFLGVVLVSFENLFGIPASTLYKLAALPILFAIYDFFCYQKEIINLGRYLKVIAVINVLYCCLSIGFSFYHMNTITSLGWSYILCEILMVMLLAWIEFKVASRLNIISSK